MRRSSRTTEDSSSGRIMRLVPKFVQTDNASSSIKTANVGVKNPGGGGILYGTDGDARRKF